MHRASRAVSMEESRHWPQNVITKAVGVWEKPGLEIVTGAFEESDIFILCSDGLTKHVSDHEIMQYVSCCGAQAACSALVDLALERGGIDNVTVIVVRPVRKQTAGQHALAADEPPSPNIWESS